jgi:hypothetical protein
MNGKWMGLPQRPLAGHRRPEAEEEKKIMATREVSPAAADADIAAVAALFVQQNGLMHSLWSIYVVATFAAAGLAASAHTLPGWVAAAASIGFWLFALGHMSLLQQALAMAEATR